MNATFAFLFPGQGSQKVGMGAELAAAYPIARETFAEADDTLGFALSRLCFEGPDDALALTANTQPAILACSVAVNRVLEAELGLVPGLALGHSLGEFSALVAVGALPFSDALRLVRLRGEAMQQAVPAGVGGMAAVVGLDQATLQAVCDEAAQGEVVSPANENGGGQIVIAGHTAAVERATALAKRRGARAIPLRVSAPFHCALMQPAADRLAQALDPIEIGTMRAAVISNVDAAPNRDPARVKSLLTQQVTSKVRWEESVRQALAMGYNRACEVGHGRVLAGLVKRITSEIDVSCVGFPGDIDVLKVES
ncbi:MAG: ACP S-malonyltransferase [Myxococcales bacterium FL481]|nr:MAG: ACP S-malonyltransferase [Myxococcales bacterium FL481]